MKVYTNYKIFSGNWIDEIPAHWNDVNLKRATQLLYGNSLSKDNRVKGNVPVYGSNGVVGYHNNSITKAPCIIIGRKGSFGKVTYSESKCFPIDTTYYIDQTATKNNLRWVFYLLEALELDAYSKDSAVPGLSREDAYIRKIPHPPLHEQQTIANFLDRQTTQIDALIAKKQRLIELLQEYRTALINQAVTKGINPNVPMKDSGFEWLGEIPENWSIVPLKFLGEITLGKMLTPTNKGGYIEKPYLRAKNIGWESVNHIDDIKTMWFSPYELLKYRLSKDDLLISEGGEVGRTAIWNNELDECYIQNSVHKVTLYNKQNPHYFLYQSQLFGKKGYYDSIVSRVSISHLTYEKLKEIKFIVPPTEEQYAIANFLKHNLKIIDHLMQLTNKEIYHFQEYKKSLTFFTVTGKIDVRDQR